MYDEKKYLLDKNGTYFFGKIYFYFPLISNKVLFFKKNTKMYIFSTYSPKRNLQSHILPGCLKNSANKICDVMSV